MKTVSMAPSGRFGSSAAALTVMTLGVAVFEMMSSNCGSISTAYTRAAWFAKRRVKYARPGSDIRDDFVRPDLQRADHFVWLLPRIARRVFEHARILLRGLRGMLLVPNLCSR